MLTSGYRLAHRANMDIDAEVVGLRREQLVQHPQVLTMTERVGQVFQGSSVAM